MGNNAVTVDGWTAYSGYSPPPDDLGNAWVLQTLKGWYGGVDTRSSPVPRPTADGDFDGPTTRAGRKVEVGGTLIAPDEPTLLRGLDRIAAVLAGYTRTGPLVVDEVDRSITRTADVRLDGPTLANRTGRLTAEWSLALYSPDPSRYSASAYQVTLSPFLPGVGRAYPLVFPRLYGTLGSTGRVDVHNLGDSRTFPVVTFVGPVTTPTMNDDTGALTLSMALLDGEQVIVDCAARTVLYGGASRRHLLTAGSHWLALDSGANVLVFDSVSHTGTAVVEWRDSWT